MLEGEHGCGDEHGGLLAVDGGLEGGADGDFGLAEPHIAAYQAIHRLGALHILLHGGGGGELIGGIFVDEGGLELVLHIAVGRETESLNTDFRVGQLHATRSIGVHFPQLSLTEEGNLRAILYPSGTALAHRICGEACGLHDGFTRLSRLYEEHGVALVLLYTVVSDLISHLFPIGRGCCCPQSSHGPKRLRRHQV